MKYIIPIIIALAGISGMHAQDFSKFKALSDSTFRNSAEYQQANKYQKDAILFLEMLADTHPYYVKKDRQGKLMAKKRCPAGKMRRLHLRFAVLRVSPRGARIAPRQAHRCD